MMDFPEPTQYDFLEYIFHNEDKREWSDWLSWIECQWSFPMIDHLVKEGLIKKHKLAPDRWKTLRYWRLTFKGLFILYLHRRKNPTLGFH